MTTYDHAYSFEFSVSGSTCEEGSDLTAEQLRHKLKERIDSLSDEDLMVTLGAPFDSYEE